MQVEVVDLEPLRVERADDVREVVAVVEPDGDPAARPLDGASEPLQRLREGAAEEPEPVAS